jgi:N-acetylglucosamine malate deacetylase 1
MNNSDIVLAVFAHPDDDALSCFGTLARLHKEKYQVYVLVLTAGEGSNTAVGRTRLEETSAAAQLGGFKLITEDFPDGAINYDVRTISRIEKHIKDLSARVIITYFPQERGNGHQDHVTVASAVVNAARRISSVDWIVYAEPPIQGWDFSPNFFVDITDWYSPINR